MGDSTATQPQATTGERAVARPSLGRQILAAVEALRPREWTKNLLLFAGALFSGYALDVVTIERATLAALSFCLASGGIYVINDLMDIDRDRMHPRKQRRPIASGRLSMQGAVVTSVVALAGALALALALARLPLGGVPSLVAVRIWPPSIATHIIPRAATSDPYAALGGSAALFTVMLIAYIGLQIAYSLRLKHIVLIDVFAIATGFVLRAVAGAVAVAVPISPWLYVCTVLLALLLALAKRRHEFLTLPDAGIAHRQTLQDYSLPLLDQLITIVTAATIMAYSLYTFQSGTGDHRLMLTIPFVLYGIFRYLYLVQMRGVGGNPAEVLLRDRHVQWAVAGWVIVVGIALYVVPR
jgi:4-hydroxybenzoate polyprenyltransferase